MKKMLKKTYAAFYRFIFVVSPLGEIATLIHSTVLHLKFSFSSKKPEVDKERLEYYLVKHCHIVEKGLSLPEPRKGFGQPKIDDLICKARYYEEKYSTSQVSWMVRDTLREYLRFHDKSLSVLPESFLNRIEAFIAEQPAHAKGGLKTLRKSEMTTYGADSFEKFLKCRHSVRNFSEVPVEDHVIHRALTLSQNTPSVCNRQGWLAHYYTNRRDIQKLLKYQNGNAGFADSIDKLIIVTASNKAFTRYEHNQVFVDGGLYSMNLMLALHSVGLGACPLNTCMPWFKEARLKKLGRIPKYERLIMMIAVGNLLEEFSVAQSEKYPLEKIVRQY